MTWKNHYVATGALAFVLTGRLDVTLAAMATAALPDQLEVLLPLGKHRGATHWVGLWLAVLAAVPYYFPNELRRIAPALLGHHGPQGHTWHLAIGAAAFGLALGPLLHVLLDGCSRDGVPVVPFSRARLQLSLYRTRNHRWPWDVSEWVFLWLLLAACWWGWHHR